MIVSFAASLLASIVAAIVARLLFTSDASDWLTGTFFVGAVLVSVAAAATAIHIVFSL